MSDRKVPKKARTRSLTVRLPVPLITALESEAKQTSSTLSQIVRNRLASPSQQAGTDRLAPIRDLIGPVKGLPPDLSARTKHYLKLWGYGKNRTR